MTNPVTETKSIGSRRRAGALLFAHHPDYFIMTRHFASIFRDLIPPIQIIVTRQLPSIYRDSRTLASLGQGRSKKHGSPTRTPTHQTAGPSAPNVGRHKTNDKRKLDKINS